MRNINELIGLVNGIDFDGVINEKEIDRLQAWVDKSRNLAYEAKEIELINLIDAILEDHIITDDEKETLISFCNKYRDDRVGNVEIYVLQGILEGIISDGVLNEQEIGKLANWLKRNKASILELPKCKEMIASIENIISDGVVTEDERKVLLDIIDTQIEDVHFETKIESLRKQIRERKNIGMDLIDMIGNEEAIKKIHFLAQKELKKSLTSYYGEVFHDREIIFISLTIIAMLYYEEGRYYENVQREYAPLYADFSAPKIEGAIRSLLYRYKVNKDTNERQLNVALRNAIVPGYYLGAFFDFVFDIYKLNFQYDLPDDLYSEFEFVYEGLRQNMLSEGDDVQINVTRKTYKLIRTTKQLITDETGVDAVIKLSILIVRLIDKKVWNKEIKVYNPYLRDGFEKWSQKLPVQSKDLEGKRTNRELRSRWEPRYKLLNNKVYIVPPIHRIKADYDHSNIRVEIENKGDVICPEQKPFIREIIGGYEIDVDKIELSNPLGEVRYRLLAGEEVIYDSKDTLFRDVICFSYDNCSEVKNNSDFGGTVVFCLDEEASNVEIYHKNEHYYLAQYGAHVGDTVLIGDNFFNFSSLVRPGIFGEELEEHCLFDVVNRYKCPVFVEPKCLVFESTNTKAEIEIIIDGQAFRLNDLECKTRNREGVVKYIIDIPNLKSGFHLIKIYELDSNKRKELSKFEFAIDRSFSVDIKSVENDSYYVTVRSDLLDSVVGKTLSADVYTPYWLRINAFGHEFAYLFPLAFNYYTLDNKDEWKRIDDDLWIGDIKSDSLLAINNRRVTELQVYDSRGTRIGEPVKLMDRTAYMETRIGFLNTYSTNNSVLKLVFQNEFARLATIICYTKCVLSEDTSVEYNSNSKTLDILSRYHGQGFVYFTIKNEGGDQIFKSSIISDGELVSVENLEPFTQYTIEYYVRKSGLSLLGDEKIGEISKTIYSWPDLIGKSFRIKEVSYDQLIQGHFVRKIHYFNKTTLCITKQLSADTFEGELYNRTSQGNYYLSNINPVEVEICGDGVGGSVELAITKDGDGLYLDFQHHNVLDSLDSVDAVDIFSYLMDLKGIEFV